jgi:hypothetical protein
VLERSDVIDLMLGEGCLFESLAVLATVALADAIASPPVLSLSFSKI